MNEMAQGTRVGAQTPESLSTKLSRLYVLDADISDYFGSIVRSKLMEILRKRIMDEAILRLIGKWLRVGVIEEKRLLVSENGIYQGTNISPVLANIYLHEVLDLWFEKEVKPRMRGETRLYRMEAAVLSKEMGCSIRRTNRSPFGG